MMADIENVDIEDIDIKDIETEREVTFARTLERVKRLAKEQGNCISKEQVQAEFARLSLKKEQLKLVFDYLESQKIGVGEPADPDSFLTREDRNYLEDYLETVAALPVYSEGETQAFILSAMAGEAQAQRKVAEIYLRDVVDVAKLYTGQGVLLEDLIGEGNMALALGSGMLGCLEKPSEAGGMLVRMVMDAMEDCIRENARGQKADRAVESRVNRVADGARELAEELGRKVTPRELSEAKGISLKSILDVCRLSGGKIEDIEYAEENL